MPLVEIETDPSPVATLPPPIQDYLSEVDRRIQGFLAQRADRPIPAFVPSDFPRIYSALRQIEQRGLAPGPLFCEWGSGFGVVASLAAMLRFEAYGIEVEEVLVEESLRLARDFEVPVEFAQGSFVPEGSEVEISLGDDLVWLADHGEDAYELLGLDARDFDLIFAYPWPGEEATILDLFERHAASGALLLLYQGIESLSLHRRM